MTGINKKLLVSSIALWMAMFAAAQKPLKLFSELGLKENVKTLSLRTYEALDNFGKPEKGDRSSDNADYTFLKNGDLDERNIYNQNGSLRTRHVYLYDAAGKMIEQNMYDKGGPLRLRFRYKYNNNGHLYEQRSFKPDGTMVSKYTYEYDKRGNQVLVNAYTGKNEIIERTVYLYDSANNQTAWQSYDADSTLVMKASYSYNLYGNLIEENLYDGDGNLEKKSLMIYEPGNKISALVEYSGNYVMVKTVQYKYDAQNNIIDEVWYDKDNNILDHYTNKYTYDKKKNWIKKTAYRNQVAVTIAEREITYFK
ncbi:MAG: hypothetical protein V4685_08470 [Bacteroidota bacterium]